MRERVWLDEAGMDYPKKWLVSVNAERGEFFKLFAEVYKVFDTHKEALALKRKLESEGEWGKVVITKGFDDTPRIGGILADVT